jgi:hypothetical protein
VADPRAEAISFFNQGLLWIVGVNIFIFFFSWDHELQGHASL